MTMVEINSFGELQEFTGYRLGEENYGEIISHGLPQFADFKKAMDDYEWKPPKQIDPRPWFDMEQQGRMGACQGNALAESGEFLAIISSGERIQLSRSFAYLASQEVDGFLGSDGGSTLSGGTKAATRGLPLESAMPYSDDYRSELAEYKQKKSELLSGPLWKFTGAVPLADKLSAYQFLSTWMGPIQIGINWPFGNGWEINSFRSGGGGHSVLVPGYIERIGWWQDIGFLLKNSWGKSYGREGWSLINPMVWDQMFASRYNVALGRTDMTVPSKLHFGNRLDAARAAGFEIAM